MNSRKLIIIALALTAVASATAQTVIPGGSVSGTWETSGSPYLIEGQITITTGDSLVIEPGVDVIFQGHFKFIVNGRLEAVGTRQDSIVFTSANISEGWHGIRLIGSTAYGHLSYCAIQYGRAFGGSSDHFGGGIYCYGSDSIIDHCTLHHNSAESEGGGLFLDNCSPAISFCSFSDNSSFTNGGAITCQINASPVISHCTFSGNSSNNGGAISAWIGCSPDIQNCTFIGNWAVYNNGAIICQCNSSPRFEDCLIDQNWANWLGRGIFCSEDDSATFRNCTITNNVANVRGGGICTDFSNAAFDDCIISDNYAGVEGGGIYFCRYSPRLDSCIVSENESPGGGGVYCVISSPYISHCFISDNVASTSGGGIACEDSDPDISFCTISANSAVVDGGGMILTESSSPTLSGCTIWGNSAEGQFGGGVECSQSSPTFINCTIAWNSALSNGGGLRCMNSSPTFYYCTVSNNTASGGSGGGILLDQCNAPINNCTFASNTSGSYGGGIACLNTEMALRNSIVEGSRGGGGIHFEASPNASVSYGDFYRNQGGNFTGSSLPPGLGDVVAINANGDSCDVFYNILLNPDFVYPAQSDYRLDWGSPCIDAGDPNPSYYDPDGTVADMGAFYYDQSIPIRILLTPHDTPIQIPAGGGNFDYTIQVTSIDPLPQMVSIWCNATLPSGTVYGPVLGPVSVTLDSGVTIQRERTQSVPGGAPSGTYTYNAYALVGGETSTDSFNFLKLAWNGSDCISGWSDFGESLNIETDPESRAALLPAHSLEQNYPNPFNPQTTIRFSLPEPAVVSLEIYDVTGRLVATLVKGWRKAGYREVTFDASALAGGIYIYRLDAGDFNVSKKMIFLK